MKKVFKTIIAIFAALIAISYVFGYQYLFKGISKTYLRGETSATIDDGPLFTNSPIHAGKPRPWIKDSAYNTKKLPKTLVEDLTNTNTAAFVVIKDGKILHEEYWDGYGPTSKTNSFSMAKGITSLLMGKAIDEGKFKSENQKISDFYENYKNIPFGKEATIKNLVTMEAGLDWDEAYYNPFGPNAKAYYGNSLAETTLLRGFKDKPGTKFEYQSGATQLLGFVLRKAINQPIASYATHKLWTPLGMEQNAYWSTDDNNMEKTFCCIHSNAKDYAKIGQLVLNNGKVDSIQIISQNYIEHMRTPTPHSKGAYGYGIWINQDAKYKHYYFWGILGQYIIVVPEKNIVIVRTGNNTNIVKDEKGRPTQVNLIVEEIVNQYL